MRTISFFTHNFKSIFLNFLFLLIIDFVYAQSLTFEKTDEGAWITDEGEKVLFYQAKTKSMNGTYPRADYIHPLYGIDGFELTEDFPEDHLHHRGIFWAWHQIIIGGQHIGDAWECRDFIWDVKQIKLVESKDDAITFQSEVLWKSNQWTDNAGNLIPFMEETSKIKVYKKIYNYRIIDVEVSLLAFEANLKIGGSEDEKGYGGFSVRMKMPEDILFTSSEGEVKPENTQVIAGPWMDISGSLAKDGGKAGIIIMCHPDNPMFPEKWILRKTGSMQNPVYPGRDPVPVSTEMPTILKYRLLVYRGDIDKERIQTLFEAQ